MARFALGIAAGLGLCFGRHYEILCGTGSIAGINRLLRRPGSAAVVDQTFRPSQARLNVGSLALGPAMSRRAASLKDKLPAAAAGLVQADCWERGAQPVRKSSSKLAGIRPSDKPKRFS